MREEVGHGEGAVALHVRGSDGPGLGAVNVLSEGAGELPRGHGCDGVERRGGHGNVHVVTHDGDTARARVEAAGVGAGNVAVQATRAPFKDLPVFVDDDVVAEIGPTEGFSVVGEHTAHNLRALRRRVGVGAARVVNADCLEFLRVAQARGVNRVCVPLFTGDERWRAGAGRHGRRQNAADAGTAAA